MEFLMTNGKIERSALASLLDDKEEDAPRSVPQPQTAPARAATTRAGPVLIVRAVDIWAEGDPVLLQPDGVLIRWPRGEKKPKPGDRITGRSLFCAAEDERETIRKLLRGYNLERCDAAGELPPRIVAVFYSAPMARNMRRVARNLCPSLRAHVAALLSRGIQVSIKVLIKVAAGRTDAEQWSVYRSFLE